MQLDTSRLKTYVLNSPSSASPPCFAFEAAQLTTGGCLWPSDVEIDEDSDDDDEPIDWWAFWRDVDEGEVGDDDMEDERDMEVTAQQKVRRNFNGYITQPCQLVLSSSRAVHVANDSPRLALPIS